MFVEKKEGDTTRLHLVDGTVILGEILEYAKDYVILQILHSTSGDAYDIHEIVKVFTRNIISET